MNSETGMGDARGDASASDSNRDRRCAERFSLDAPYTEVRITREDGQPCNPGHAYDISTSGVRFELDAALPLHERVDLELVLPGKPPTHIQGRGEVVRHHDTDEAGPTRMAVAFTQVDSDALANYLEAFKTPR